MPKYSEPTFPYQHEGDGGQTISHPGISLRDYFAGQVIASIPLRAWEGAGHDIILLWAKCAYATADAMLAEREKELLR